MLSRRHIYLHSGVKSATMASEEETPTTYLAEYAAFPYDVENVRVTNNNTFPPRPVRPPWLVD